MNINSAVSAQLASLTDSFKTLQSKATEAARHINAITGSACAEIAEARRKYKAGLPTKLKVLADNGWFIYGFRTPSKAIYPISAAFEAGRLDEANNAMCWHFDKVASEIEADLSGRFPNRASILKRAFAAHMAGNYELSILAFLAQADGIGREALGKSISSIYTQRSDKKAEIKQLISVFESEAVLGSEFLDVVLLSMPLNCSGDKVPSTKGVLNRNLVLHGATTDYGTLLNSCRAISWLDYVAFLHKLSNRKKSKAACKVT